MSDPLAVHGRALRAKDPRDWKLNGSYIELPRRGRYLAVFRVRLDPEKHAGAGLGRMVFDVSYFSREHNRSNPRGPVVTAHLPSYQYVPVAIEFDYADKSEEIELRMRCRPHRGGAEAQYDPYSIRIDCISVLRLGGL